MSEQRPDPDALLAKVQREEAKRKRGRLKIFLGAAAGVGKTYSMLLAAREKRAEGADAVVGIVETHGRADTAALLDGLEILAPRIVGYRGASLREFDLDAALKRRPAIIVVDELAHTNVEGSRHPKRWNDVEELLDAGIDVVGEAGDAVVLLERVRTLRPDVAIVDIRMPPTHTDEGLVAADRIRVEQPETGVLVLSQYVESSYAMRLLADHPGSSGYLLKERVFDVAVLVDALQRVADGETVVNRVLAQGESQTFEARGELVLSVGNAGGLSFSVNDRPGVPLGRAGEVKRNIVITRKNLPKLVEDHSS